MTRYKLRMIEFQGPERDDWKQEDWPEVTLSLTPGEYIAQINSRSVPTQSHRSMRVVQCWIATPSDAPGYTPHTTADQT